MQVTTYEFGPSSSILFIEFPPYVTWYIAIYFYVPPTAIIFSSLLNYILSILPYYLVLNIIFIPVKSTITKSKSAELVAIILFL